MGFSAYNNSTNAQKSQVIIHRIIKSYMNNFTFFYVNMFHVKLLKQQKKYINKKTIIILQKEKKY